MSGRVPALGFDWLRRVDMELSEGFANADPSFAPASSSNRATRPASP